MKRLSSFITFLALCSVGLSALADSLPAARVSEKQKSARESYFEFPFLMAQTAVYLEKNPEEITGRVKVFLNRGKLPISGHYAKQKTDSVEIQLPEEARAGNQLEAIEDCSETKCKIKLNTEREKKAMQSSTAKLNTFKSLVAQRVRAFLAHQEWLGYEDRVSNQEYLSKMMELFPGWKQTYPATTQFFTSGFWKGAPAPANLAQTFLREELAIIAPDRLQPIWRIGEVFEFDEKTARTFWEIHIYSNHYMDSSLRVIEILPREKGSVLVISDIMEIDELTKSGFIRMLYKGKMGDAVLEAQDQDLKKVLSS